MSEFEAVSHEPFWTETPVIAPRCVFYFVHVNHCIYQIDEGDDEQTDAGVERNCTNPEEESPNPGFRTVRLELIDVDTAPSTRRSAEQVER